MSTKLLHCDWQCAAREFLIRRHALPDADFAFDFLCMVARSERPLAFHFDPNVIAVDLDFYGVTYDQVLAWTIPGTCCVGEIVNLYHKTKAVVSRTKIPQLRLLVRGFIARRSETTET